MEAYFIHMSTLGRGSVPYLPVELREIIWSFLYPSIWIQCNICSTVIFQQTSSGKLLMIDLNYKMWDDVARCSSCAGQPRVNNQLHLHGFN